MAAGGGFVDTAAFGLEELGMVELGLDETVLRRVEVMVPDLVDVGRSGSSSCMIDAAVDRGGPAVVEL